MAAKTFNVPSRAGLLLLSSALATVLLTGCLGGSSKNYGASSGGNASSNTFATDTTSSNAGAPDIIRVGDDLMIRLTGVPDGEEGVYDEPVTDEGNISMKLLGSFKAAGKTLGQLKSEIETAYRDRRIYKTPNITISQQLRYVNVLGEVRAPQRVTFTSDLTILRVISACGGFTDYAQKRDVKLLRGGKQYDFNAVEALRDPSLDVPLRAGDQIQVPRTIF